MPLLASWNLDESKANSFLKGAAPTIENYESKAREKFGEKADAFPKANRAENTDEVKRSAADYAGDEFIGFGTWKWIEEHVATGGSSVWRYRFDQTLPLPIGAAEGEEVYAAHSWDIEYVFRVLDSKKLPRRSEDYKVSELMASYWTNFAKTGNLNRKGLPKWPAYNSKKKKPVMMIDATPKLKSDVHRARYEFWEGM